MELVRWNVRAIATWLIVMLNCGVLSCSCCCFLYFVETGRWESRQSVGDLLVQVVSRGCLCALMKKTEDRAKMSEKKVINGLLVEKETCTGKN